MPTSLSAKSSKYLVRQYHYAYQKLNFFVLQLILKEGYIFEPLLTQSLNGKMVLAQDERPHKIWSIYYLMINEPCVVLFIISVTDRATQVVRATAEVKNPLNQKSHGIILMTRWRIIRNWHYSSNILVWNVWYNSMRSSLADMDPPGSEFIVLSRIRIHIGTADPDPCKGESKWCPKSKK